MPPVGPLPESFKAELRRRIDRADRRATHCDPRANVVRRRKHPARRARNHPTVGPLPESFEAELRRRIDRADRLLHTLYTSSRNAERRAAIHERMLYDVENTLRGALEIIRLLCRHLPRDDEMREEELPPPLALLDGAHRANVIDEHYMTDGNQRWEGGGMRTSGW